MNVNDEWFLSNIENCKKILGKKRIESKLNQVDFSKDVELKRLERRTPLLYSIYLADKSLKAHSPEVPMTDQIILLANLGNSLTILKNNGVKGIKIDRLFQKNFRKTVYELYIATLFSKNGFKVEFIPEGPKKTPDLMIQFENGIEVECKKKDEYTPNDKQNITFWERVTKEAIKLMDNYSKNLIIILETDDYPKNSDFELIVNILKNEISDIKNEKYTYNENGIELIIRQTEPFNKIIYSPEFVADPYYQSCNISNPVKRFYRGSVHIETEIVNGVNQFKNPRLFGFNCKKMPDRVQSIIKSIEKGKNQLSGDKPGLIFVDHNIFDRDTAETDLSRLRPLINKILRQNSKVSGVVITQEIKAQLDKGFLYEHKAFLFSNENSKYPLNDEMITKLQMK